MGKALIIVESPKKGKTLSKFLGTQYQYESSKGHIRDLPEKGFGIEVENNFEPIYENLSDKQEVIDRLKKAAKAADMVYLATDPDREGEAIAWHIASILPAGAKYKRITFNEFTKPAVQEALKHPREINQDLVDSQQARRILDRIVGYKISPILTRRVQGSRQTGLSAGRVQSVALKLVVDREKEIDAFVPLEYWKIAALLHSHAGQVPFTAFLYTVDGKRIEKEPVEGKDLYTISNHKTAAQVVERLKKANFKVDEIERKEKKRNPVPPFITSTIQQEASRHFGFSASKTMTIAQKLYEGVELGDRGIEGLITYMRTDSVRLSPEAVESARKLIKMKYGKDYLPDTPRVYPTKKSSQDAHEAIRPTHVDLDPDSIQHYLTIDELKLYSLIWKRFISCQMTPAIYDTVGCAIGTDQGIVLRCTGATIKFPGFLAVYQEKQDIEDEEKEKEEEKLLPHLEVGEKLKLGKLDSEQAFTKPPHRFTEASLVKELEKSGIGRPSTYAAIMNKIQSRDYTVKEKGSLKPTELGKVIAQMLEENFPIIMDVGFTAKMEDELEKVEYHERDWKGLIEEFWNEFMPTVELAEKQAFVPKIDTDLKCPKCGSPLQKIWSKRKYFYGCSTYPDCDYTMPLEKIQFNKEDYDPTFDWNQKCPKCGSDMTLRFGKFGAFLGCSKYPECSGIVSIPKKGEVVMHDLPPCPAIGCDGHIMQRRSRFGKTFFSCSNFPDCNVIVNEIDKLAEKYPDHPKTPYVKRERKFGKKGKTATAEKGKGEKGKKTAKTKVKREGGGLSKEVPLSNEMAAFLGKKEASRGEVTKGIWAYIKAHNCQDAKDKRLIVPDKALQTLLGTKEKIPMMKLASFLKKHFKK